MLTIILIVTTKKIFNNNMQKWNEKGIIMVHHQKINIEDSNEKQKMYNT